MEYLTYVIGVPLFERDFLFLLLWQWWGCSSTFSFETCELCVLAMVFVCCSSPSIVVIWLTITGKRTNDRMSTIVRQHEIPLRDTITFFLLSQKFVDSEPIECVSIRPMPLCFSEMMTSMAFYCVAHVVNERNDCLHLKSLLEFRRKECTKFTWQSNSVTAVIDECNFNVFFFFFVKRQKRMRTNIKLLKTRRFWQFFFNFLIVRWSSFDIPSLWYALNSTEKVINV